MPTKIEVKEMFGKFFVNTKDGIIQFDSEPEAKAAAVLSARSEEFESRAAAYCVSRGLSDKSAAAKTNIIKDFLAFEASLEDSADEINAAE